MAWNLTSHIMFLAVLMDKGIVIGAEHEAAVRMNLPSVMFRQSTSVRMFGHNSSPSTERDSVPPFPPPYPFTLPRSWPHRGSGHLRFLLQRTDFLRSRARNPPSHYRGGGGRSGKYPNKPDERGSPCCGRVFGPFRRCAGRGGRLRTQNGDDTVAEAF